MPLTSIVGRCQMSLQYLVLNLNVCFIFMVSGKSNEALEIFNKMQEAGVLPDKVTCNNLIEICCKTGEIRAIMKILEYMKEKFFVLRYPIYQKALEAFEIAGESDILLRQVNRHISAGYSNESNNTYDSVSPDSEFEMENDLVLYLMKKHNLVSIDSMLADMADKGVRLASNVISKIIEVSSTHHRPNGALLAYEYSLKMGIKIEKTAYLTLIGFSIRVNSFHKVVEIIDKLVEQGLSLGPHLNSLLIHRLGCTRNADSAAKVFDLLPNKEKSSAEYTALMSAHFFSGDFKKGLETFETMKNQGVNIALGTYCVLVAGLEKCSKARDVEYYRKERKRFQIERGSQNLSIEETVCNLLFARDFITDYT